MEKFLKNLLNSKSGVSSKRLITIFAFLLLSVGFIANLFWDLTIDEHIYNSMEMIVEIGMGTIVAERFARGTQNKKETTEENPEEN
jgi:hypothetical protein